MTASSKKTLVGEALVGVAGIIIIIVPIWVAVSHFLLAAKIVWVLTLLAFVLLCIVIVVWALAPKELEKDLKDDLAKGEVGDFHIIGLPLMLLGSFLLCSFSMWRIWGSAAFTGASQSPTTWLLYLADNLVRSVFFDVAETFYMDISPIDQARTFWPCAFVFIFRTVTSVGVIRVALTAWVAVRDRTGTT